MMRKRSNTGSPEVILHIGLHKTGTRYLQREVFQNLDPARYLCNPENLQRPLRRAVRNPDNAECLESARLAVRAWRTSGDQRTLVLSEPHVSGDMYGNHADCIVNADLMGQLFPEARILYFVRNQSAWLQSAYRQQLVKGGSVPIHVFLNYYDGMFRERPDRWVYGARTVEALNQRFLHIYQAYADVFGAERVHLFRQEDLRQRPELVKAGLARVLGLQKLPEARRDRVQNRSYSALAIRIFHPMSAKRYTLPESADCGRPRRRFRRLLRPLTRFRRIFIQHVFDRLFYVDWDLLKSDDLGARIDAHYASENAEIRRIADTVLQSLVRLDGDSAQRVATSVRVTCPNDDDGLAADRRHR